MDSSKINEIKQIENTNVRGNHPDERGNVSIQGNVKIFDPETKEVFVNVRT